MASKIRILFVIANAEFSGAERQLLLLATNLDKSKFNAEVCCLEREGTFTDAVKETGLPLHIIQRRRSLDLRRLISLVRLIKKRKYQIVHSFTWSANQYSRLARLFIQFKLVSGERGRNLVPINMENIIDRILAPISDHIVFNSNVQFKKYMRGKTLEKRSISVIHNGIDLERFQKTSQSALRSLLYLEKGIRLIGTVGNFTEHKNFQMFIEVCRKTTSKISNVHFVAIGDGKNKDYYDEVLKKNGLENKLSLPGRRKDITTVFTSLDIFLLTSTWEGMPNVIIEAMASKVPVISTNVDGCKEIIQDHINGFLVDSVDVDNMVSKIILLLENTVLRQKIIQNGIQTVKSNFSLEKMVAEHSLLYLSHIKNYKY